VERNKWSSKRFFLIPIILVIGLFGRVAFLEYTDLIDPTEARYAVVAQLMVSTTNWLTPMLPMPEGVVPYLGKPPLHFWLTAASYTLFGVDEWSARLPSFIDTLLIVGAIWVVGALFFSRRMGWIAALIYLSAAMPFFLAGASVTDTTLTAFVTLSVVTLYLSITQKNYSFALVITSAILAALSFLSKGPISLVLIWLPIILWSFMRKDYSWMRRFPWIPAVATFLLVTSPWFVLSERENPGFLRYFFWNENIARYLFKEYGDRYGSGHVHSYGMSWLMLVAGFFPWSLFITYFALKCRGQWKAMLEQKNERVLFLLCWSLSTPIFFTFVKQLHGMYLLPAMPPLALLTAYSISEHGVGRELLNKFYFSKYMQHFFIVFGLSVVTAGAILNFNIQALLISLVLLVFGYSSLKAIKSFADSRELSFITGSFLLAYLCVISSISPFLNVARSSEIALQKISYLRDCQHDGSNHKVGVSSRNSFSHYWTASAWENELSNPVYVNYVAPDKVTESNICHYLYKARTEDTVPSEVKKNFTLYEQSGDWLVYSRNMD
jgi:4-amino-4-deoxy-L-arabinose transferase-like glycosyltransferase